MKKTLLFALFLLSISDVYAKSFWTIQTIDNVPGTLFKFTDDESFDVAIIQKTNLFYSIMFDTNDTFRINSDSLSIAAIRFFDNDNIQQSHYVVELKALNKDKNSLGFNNINDRALVEYMFMYLKYGLGTINIFIIKEDKDSYSLTLKPFNL